MAEKYDAYQVISWRIGADVSGGTEPRSGGVFYCCCAASKLASHSAA